jgi:hypothetical protein
VVDPLQCRLLALRTNIRLNWKGFPWSNVLANYEHEYLTDIKSFVTLGPAGEVVLRVCSLLARFQWVCVKVETVVDADLFAPTD